MNKIINYLIKHPLFSGSMIMIIGNNLSSGILYLFQIIIGRKLGPGDYGELVALISVVSLIGVIPSSIGPTIIKFISSASSKEELSGLIEWFIEKSWTISIILFLILLIASIKIAEFININNIFLVIIMSIASVITFQVFILRSILQGILKFNIYVLSLFLENSLRLILGLIMVGLGFKVFGVVIGILISLILVWIFIKYFIGQYTHQKSSFKVKVKPMLKYSLPVIIYSISITSFFSTDLILVKHFFSSYDTGIYASTANFSKIIIYGTSPIAGVMFPIIANRHSKGQKYFKIFIYSFILTISIALGILLVYYLFSPLIINLLYGSSYLAGTNLIVQFGLFAAFFTLGSLIVNYYMSLGQTKIAYFPLIGALVQGIGIFYFHSNLEEVIQVSIFTSGILLLSLFAYLLLENKEYLHFK